MADTYDRDRLAERLRKAEGYRAEPYLDIRGYLTVGIGHLIHHQPIRILPQRTMGELWEWLTSKERHERWFQEDIDAAIMKARQWYAEIFDELSGPRQEVTIEMFFQMGHRARFPRMRDALSVGDYDRAADEMMNSLWAKQTPGRARLLASIMRTDTA